MTSPRLEIKRADNSPKCCTCRNWAARDAEHGQVAECELLKVRTLDLAVCSAWELHEVLVGQIMEPES